MHRNATGPASLYMLTEKKPLQFAGVECVRGPQLPPGAGGEVHDHSDPPEGEGGPGAVHCHRRLRLRGWEQCAQDAWLLQHDWAPQDTLPPRGLPHWTQVPRAHRPQPAGGSTLLSLGATSPPSIAMALQIL
jgi:hypothetical protein